MQIAKLSSRSVVIALAALAVPAAHAQNCYSKESIVGAREKIEALLREHGRASEEYLSLLTQKRAALGEVNDCRTGRSLSGDLDSLLSLRDPSCNRQIDKFNQIESMADGKKQDVDFLMGRVNMMTAAYTRAQANVCAN